ncbi:hypothetical protein H0H93_010061 [Arthromyces matolae]|nr:hypothetical protein H0H93_010061 [Arthromyces matolae]
MAAISSIPLTLISTPIPYLVCFCAKGLFLQLTLSTEDDSPYPEVRSAVANYDDPDMPSSTLRAWILGLCWAILIPGMNQFFYLRYPSVAIGGLVAQLLAFPIGRLSARLLPNITIFGLEVNPGPFSIKEHVIHRIAASAPSQHSSFCFKVLVTIMASVGAQSAYATDIVAVQRVFYHQSFPWICVFMCVVTWSKANLVILDQWLLVMSTQLIGFSIGGVARRFLVAPPSMNFVPGYLFEALRCAGSPQTTFGLGFSLLTFDWNQIAYIGSPSVVLLTSTLAHANALFECFSLATPWWAEANVMIGFFFFYWFLTPIFYASPSGLR